MRARIGDYGEIFVDRLCVSGVATKIAEVAHVLLAVKKCREECVNLRAFEIHGEHRLKRAESDPLTARFHAAQVANVDGRVADARVPLFPGCVDNGLWAPGRTIDRARRKKRLKPVAPSRLQNFQTPPFEAKHIGTVSSKKKFE